MLILNIIFTALVTYGSFVALRTVLIHIKLLIIRTAQIRRNESMDTLSDEMMDILLKGADEIMKAIENGTYKPDRPQNNLEKLQYVFRDLEIYIFSFAGTVIEEHRDTVIDATDTFSKVIETEGIEDIEKEFNSLTPILYKAVIKENHRGLERHINNVKSAIECIK